MRSESGLERRVRRLENETGSIYELIDEFRAETRERFAAHDARFDAVDARFDAVDARFDGMDARLVGLEASMAEVLRRLPKA